MQVANAYKISVQNLMGIDRMQELGRMWEKNIKLDLKKNVWGCGLDTSALGYGRASGALLWTL